ncbi:MAG: DUF927 domain-containing protein [Trichlorobacter sp.]|uniref:DUF927 domain-containing protein n=1 Tax=Trichlorobacter sp. TaxID=2911007 RepID=UPI00256BAF91|nr:DUF927 domain-containing protein [Trichlorobacter sp.]MDK9716831.1 DUF927 domain-containing protein [Trichlorobacter sp.]
MAVDSDFNDLAAKPDGKRRVAEQIGSVASAGKALVVFGPFETRAGGVYWTPAAKKDDEAQAVFFCSYIKPLGIARTAKGEDFSILFEMVNPDQQKVVFLLRNADLQKAGGEVARIEFAARGGFFGVGIRARQLFGDFVSAILKHSRNLPRFILVDRTGWVQIAGRWLFILPDSTIGEEVDKK